MRYRCSRCQTRWNDRCTGSGIISTPGWKSSNSPRVSCGAFPRRHIKPRGVATTINGADGRTRRGWDGGGGGRRRYCTLNFTEVLLSRCFGVCLLSVLVIFSRRVMAGTRQHVQVNMLVLKQRDRKRVHRFGSGFLGRSMENGGLSGRSSVPSSRSSRTPYMKAGADCHVPDVPRDLNHGDGKRAKA